MSLESLADRIGEYTCLDGETEASLCRNKKAYTNRDGGGSDDEWVGVAPDKREMDVSDARAFDGEHRHALNINSFE